MDDTKKYAMLCKTVQGGAIRSLVEVLKECIHDVALSFTPAGVRLVTMDGARCALVYMKLEAQNFEVFHCPGRVTVGVNMTCLFKLLRSMGSQDMLTLYSEEDAPERLGIIIHNSEKNSTTHFKMKLLDVDEEVIELPSKDFHSVFTVPSAYWQRLMRDMSNIGDTLHMRCLTDGSLSMSVDGDFASQETVIGPSSAEAASSGMLVNSKCADVVEGRFSLKYLSLFARAANLASTLMLFARNDYLLLLKYNIASLGELRFCLAPKIS